MFEYITLKTVIPLRAKQVGELIKNGQKKFPPPVKEVQMLRLCYYVTLLLCYSVTLLLSHSVDNKRSNNSVALHPMKPKKFWGPFKQKSMPPNFFPCAQASLG